MKKMTFAMMIAAGLMTASFANAQTADKKAVNHPAHRADKPVQAEQITTPHVEKEKASVKKVKDTKTKETKVKAAKAK